MGQTIILLYKNQSIKVYLQGGCFPKEVVSPSFNIQKVHSYFEERKHSYIFFFNLQHIHGIFGRVFSQPAAVLWVFPRLGE